MRRLLLNQLLAWQQQSRRKPLLIDGARQTGKTYLLQRLLGASFPAVLRVDFLERPELAAAFAEALTPLDIIDKLQLLTNQSFNPNTDLLILDEIGECPRAVTALKFFAEQAPQMFVAASGSNIGLLDAFPVGKVEQHNLRPLNFHEFLLASGEAALIRAFEQQANNAAAHQRLFDKLTDYYFTGGMPEAVSQWFAADAGNILERVAAVAKVQQDLISGYLRDFGKYAGKADAQLIEAVFRSVPNQLSLVQDESVRRFRFKDVHEKRSRYSDFETAISWLENCRLLLKNHPLEGQPKSPLAAYLAPNKVKLFMFDVGLLCRMLDLSYLEIKEQAYEYKGYITENFVQQEFFTAGLEPTYSWQDARAEIEFIASDGKGNIIPIEVKSGRRTRAKSLQSYVQKCNPLKTIKLTGTQGSPALERQHLVIPLYFAQYVVSDHLR